MQPSYSTNDPKGWCDSSYDLDHRGFWGASSVPGSGARFSSRDVARDLIDQARDMKACAE